MNQSFPRVNVCLGTTCYVMGAAELMDSLETSTAARGCVVSGSTCLGTCTSRSGKSAPFVRVGETILAQATVEAIRDAVDSATLEAH